MNTARMRPTAVSDHSIPPPELGAQRTCSGPGFPVATKTQSRPHLLAPSQEVPSREKGTRGLHARPPLPDPKQRGVISPAHAEPSTEGYQGSLSHSSCGT